MVRPVLLTGGMGDAHNDNGTGGTRVLEARFHPNGNVNEFIVVGQIYCRASWAVLEVALDFEDRVPRTCSADSIVSNLAYLTIMSRPRPFERLLSLENRYWSFVVPAPRLDQASP